MVKLATFAAILHHVVISCLLHTGCLILGHDWGELDFIRRGINPERQRFCARCGKVKRYD